MTDTVIAAPLNDAPYRRWIATHLLADSSGYRLVGVRRPAWSVAPPGARQFRIGHLTQGARS